MEGDGREKGRERKDHLNRLHSLLPLPPLYYCIVSLYSTDFQPIYFSEFSFAGILELPQEFAVTGKYKSSEKDGPVPC